MLSATKKHTIPEGSSNQFPIIVVTPWDISGPRLGDKAEGLHPLIPGHQRGVDDSRVATRSREDCPWPLLLVIDDVRSSPSSTTIAGRVAIREVGKSSDVSGP